MAGIQAFGPAALPYLKKARESAEGVQAAQLDQAIQRLSRPTRARGAGRSGGARRSMLDLQEKLLEQVGLTEEQKAVLAKMLPLWREKEKQAVRHRQEGDRDAARNVYMELQYEVREKLDEILTEEQKSKLEELRQGLRRRRPGGGR